VRTVRLVRLETTVNRVDETPGRPKEDRPGDSYHGENIHLFKSSLLLLAAVGSTTRAEVMMIVRIGTFE
jgi:hypothetical protein